MLLGSKAYDVLKPVAQIWLPALGTLYFTLAQTLGLPAAEEVVGTIVAVDTFLGAVLGLSSAKFNNPDNADGKFDGKMLVKDEPNKLTYQMHLNDDPANLAAKDEVLFKVVPVAHEPQHQA